MPAYKWPSWRVVGRRMFDSGWAFLRRAGTLILASMVLVWALLYFPAGHPEGGTYPGRIAALEGPHREERDELKRLEEGARADRRAAQRLQRRLASVGGSRLMLDDRLARLAEKEAKIKVLREVLDPVEDEVNELTARWKRQSYLGRLGRALEPVFRPLGWDWRVTVAALASFPAREVVVGTLGIVFRQGKVDSEEVGDPDSESAQGLGKALKDATWEDEPGRRLFAVPVALSLMVFFALCCQCASTLAVIRRETRSWRWPLFTFAYMTALAYLGALLVYQIGSRVGGA
jgi:ferrous iron transport protein B